MYSIYVPSSPKSIIFRFHKENMKIDLKKLVLEWSDLSEKQISDKSEHLKSKKIKILKVRKKHTWAKPQAVF